MTDAAEVTDALDRLALTARQLKVHKVGYLKAFEPDRADIRDFQDNLITIAGAVDRFFSTYGKMLADAGHISHTDARIYFENVVMDAISGNALYAVEAGIEERIEERAEAAE